MGLLWNSALIISKNIDVILNFTVIHTRWFWSAYKLDLVSCLDLGMSPLLGWCQFGLVLVKVRCFDFKALILLNVDLAFREFGFWVWSDGAKICSFIIKVGILLTWATAIKGFAPIYDYLLLFSMGFSVFL